MKRTLMILVVALATTLSMAAQGRGRGGQMHSAAPMHSNAPAGTPHASVDRDTGRDRAADVGQGKKNGLAKQQTRKHHKRSNHN